MRDDIKRKLDPNKSPGRDRSSIRMLKMSSDAIIKPLRNFQKLLKMWTIPDSWIKGNIVPIFKKGVKQNIKHYRPASLLPMCYKVFNESR